MSRSERPRVLAIGIDAAEPSFVRPLMDRGDLPALRELAAHGVWGGVTSPAPIASGAVWPTFLTGRTPAEHGFYGEWAWRPDTMGLHPPTWGHLDPFWRAPAIEGRTTVILDVPFAPRIDVPGCTEVLDWGLHDHLKGRLDVFPRDLEALVTEVGGVHPFASGQVAADGPQDHAGLAQVLRHCVAGAGQRGRLAQRLLKDMAPELMIVVFTELHRAGHLLWHTVDPKHPDHGAMASGDPAPPRLDEVLHAIDREIGQLRDLAGPETAIVVFSLHGMRAARGIPTILGPLLEAHGFAVRKTWRERSGREHVERALTAIKRIVPGSAKRLYRRWTPERVVSQLTQPSMPMPAYDWSRTTAFALPTDQHGWVRVNLRGRESRGCVEPGQYTSVCQRIDELLRAARDVDGQPIVRAVVRTAADARAAAASMLPDLIVHWTDATFGSPLRLGEPRLTAIPVGRQLTGQHSFRGFYVIRPARSQPVPGGSPVAAEQFHRLLGDPLG
jgi:predicted AlkP superfamily phosphohydrolase/phosphomutase